MTDDEKFTFKQKYLDDIAEVERLTKEINDEHTRCNQGEIVFPSVKAI